MKNFVPLTIFLLVSLVVNAQTMSVVEFKPDESDLTANTAGTIVLDQNGDKCALIKIETTEFGFSFDAGSLGIVKTEQHTGEVWVYIPEGVKRLSISHPKLEKIRDYDLGMSVKKAMTYIMKLHVLKPATDIGGMGTIDVKSTPVGAEVYIDDISVGKTPMSFSKLFPGKHKVTIKQEGYYDFESSVDVADNKVSIIDEILAKSCDIERTREKINITTKGVSFSLIKVDGGSFQMGGTPEQGKGKMDESPVHRVTLSDFYIGETEVTNELWSVIMGTNPSISSSQPNQPVNNVSWYDCQKFINRLSSLTGLHFALPTEAQWEFAARGGNKSRNYRYSGSNKLKEVGWFKENSKGLLNVVKQLRPNELGLYDMSGNVSEWCSDWYGLYKNTDVVDSKGLESGTLKVFRGASGGEKDAFLRVACRFCDNPNSKYQSIGLRLVLLE
jgi:formylglycine-generating enzyme required for sulfatase activity